MYVPSAYAGTKSLSWASSLATAPPDPETLIGRTKLRLLAASMLYPAGKLGGLLTYQGESDALVESESLNHASNWNAIYDELESYAGGLWSWQKTTRIWHVISPATAPSGYTYWDNVRAGQADLANRARTHTIQAPETVPVGMLHHRTGTDDTSGQRKIGAALAEDWFAAT